MNLRKLLTKYKAGQVSIEEVEAALPGASGLFFDNIEKVLIGDTGCLDPCRAARSGVPEAILAQGKRPEDVVKFLRAMAAKVGRALATRVSADTATFARTKLAGDFDLDFNEFARTLVVRRSNHTVIQLGRSIGILSAGTADVPVAEEARVVAEEMGCDIVRAYDVGVAGIHRLFPPLEEMRTANVDVIVVVAGMEGALPTVVKGFVAVPVIGVPTSTGYGHGGQGEAALMTMLQSCSPGLVVVNIDNGFGAGATAALIATRIAETLRKDNAASE